MLGFIVGMAIAGQTFYLFTVENLRQFGALKAMGTSTATLARMILLQALTVGITGYGLGVGLRYGFRSVRRTRGPTSPSMKPASARPGVRGAVGHLYVFSFDQHYQIGPAGTGHRLSVIGMALHTQPAAVELPPPSETMAVRVRGMVKSFGTGDTAADGTQR
ncbi:MAG: ABC transporter permease [Nitrospiraceae bacterium]